MDNNQDTINSTSDGQPRGLHREGEILRHVTGRQRVAGPEELRAGEHVAGRSLSLRQTVDAIVSAPGFRVVAAALPDPQRSRPGPKTPFPAELFLLYEQLVHSRTQSNLDAEVRDPVFWAFICDLFMDRFELELPADRPITRRHVETWRSQMTVEALETDVRPVLRRQAFEICRTMGLLRIGNDVDWTKPSPNNTVSGDGTWIRPWSDAQISVRDGVTVVKNSRATDLSRVRQPDEVQYFPKDGRKVEGRGYVAFHARADVAGRRITLDVIPIPRGTGEINVVRRALKTLISEADGSIHVLTYDGAVDAGDIKRFMELGVLPVAPVAASSVRTPQVVVPEKLKRFRKRHNGRGDACASSEKRCRVAPIKLVAHPEGHGVRCEHNLWAYDGDVVDVSETGYRVRVLNLCRLVGRQRVTRFDRYQFSLTVEVPCVHGSFTTTINPHGTYADGKLLAYALRPVAFSHRDYRRFTGRRNDTESAWSSLKAGMPNGRSTRLNHAHEYLHVLAAVMASNAVAYYSLKQSKDAK